VLGSDATGRKAAPRPSTFTGSVLEAFPSLRVKRRIFDDQRLRRTGDEYLSGIAAFISSGKYLVRLADNFPTERRKQSSEAGFSPPRILTGP
jgi:hypothetical protein